MSVCSDCNGCVHKVSRGAFSYIQGKKKKIVGEYSKLLKGRFPFWMCFLFLLHLGPGYTDNESQIFDVFVIELDNFNRNLNFCVFFLSSKFVNFKL